MEEIRERKEDIARMWALFMKIWKTRPHFSEVSEEYLGEIPYSYMFDHAIEKSSHPELMYEEENIILCSLVEHDLKTRGYPLPRHRLLIKEAKERFGII